MKKMSEFNDGIFYTTDDCEGCFSCVRACPVSGAAVILYKNAEKSENIIDIDDITNLSIDELDAINIEDIAISDGDENSKYAVSINSGKCINCGKCMDICSKNAVKYRDDTELFFSDLESSGKGISVIVSSALRTLYPRKYKNILGYLKSAGVNHIYSCDTGADINALITAEYMKKNPSEKGFISSSCYPVVSFIEKYHTELTKKLVPVQSDAVCTAIFARKYLKNNDKFAFIGSCISKKAEFESSETEGYISYNITIKNLVRKLAGTDISQYSSCEETPYSAGALYAFPGGMKKNLDIIMNKNNFISSADGNDFIYEYIIRHGENMKKSSEIPVISELMNCRNGCNFTGAVSSSAGKYDIKCSENTFTNEFISCHISSCNYNDILSERFSMINQNDFIRKFNAEASVKYPEITNKQINEAFISMRKNDKISQNINCGACGYKKCYDMACAVARGYDHASNCIHYMKDELSESKKQINFYQTELTSLIEEKTEQIEQFNDTMTTCIAELIDSRDNTGSHRKKVTRKYFEVFIPAIASEEKYHSILTKQFRADLLRGASLHNIGMAGISDSVLKKSGALEMNEFEHIKKHTEIGRKTFERIISQVSDASFLYVAKDMAYYHHEKWNGRGYPEGLKGENIPLSARIMAIVDVYEALTSKKSYKEPFSHEHSMQIIADERGKSFDPSLTDIFISISDKINQVREQYNSENE